ncbi:hypothetical protein [Helicobacter bilis]|nr:hypothetical protein [Helicobacter bilis]MDD7295890.1 hypothetical protein [Helicobacter bilis]MDY4400647.1 hypothetical protein [Helicobacter bilis]
MVLCYRLLDSSITACHVERSATPGMESKQRLDSQIRTFAF